MFLLHDVTCLSALLQLFEIRSSAIYFGVMGLLKIVVVSVKLIIFSIMSL